MKKVAVTGHRPDKLWGYDMLQPKYTKLRAAIRARMEELNGQIGITGMALGVDQLFAEVCIEMGIPFIAAIPFLGQASRWPTHAGLHGAPIR
jgi:uncharacterized phage-like protein YoqJ